MQKFHVLNAGSGEPCIRLRYIDIDIFDIVNIRNERKKSHVCYFYFANRYEVEIAKTNRVGIIKVEYIF